MPKQRTRIATTIKIASNDDANQALAEIGKLVLQIEAIDGKASEAIGKIKEKAASSGEAQRKRIQELENALLVYAEYNKGDLFKDKKSIEM